MWETCVSLSLEVVTSVVQSHAIYHVMDVPAGNRQSVSTLLTFHHSLSINWADCILSSTP